MKNQQPPPAYNATDTHKPSMLDLPSGVENCKNEQSNNTLAKKENTPELYLDGQLILPTTPPATALYQISRPIYLRSPTLTISRVVPGKRPGSNRDQEIYSMTRVPLVVPLQVDIYGKRSSTLPGHLELQIGLFAVRVKVWHHHHGSKRLLYSVSVGEWGYAHKWKNGEGREVARSRSGHRLEILGEVGRDERDLLATCCCAMWWCLAQSLGVSERRMEEMEREAKE